ncbi:MAG: ribonuclease HII [Chloroflexi bacterium]|nr:ribonuclease HII [Chloroflexota bacterium]MYD47279.1 ribonuclease HII [Chloroflexota bacterium]
MPDLSLEADFHAKGMRLVAGVDEAGRGPLAGPVAAAAVILPLGLNGDEDWLGIIDDSKRLSEKSREQAAEVIRANALAWAVNQIESVEIDRIGISQAVRRAMMAAVSALQPAADALLLDWVSMKECQLPFQAIVKGDAKSLSIAAASILAKVERDSRMRQADCLYPGYGFAQHKGYGTRHHIRCLSELGPTPIHRRSFNPLRQGRLIDDAKRR